jgi:hypothetical protein
MKKKAAKMKVRVGVGQVKVFTKDLRKRYGLMLKRLA